MFAKSNDCSIEAFNIFSRPGFWADCEATENFSKKGRWFFVNVQKMDQAFFRNGNPFQLPEYVVTNGFG